MRRRGWTVLVGAVVVALLTYGALSLRVPYVALGPGPTVDTLGTAPESSDHHAVIAITKGESTDSKGQLRLVTVSVLTDLDLGSAIYYWLSDSYAVLPRELVYPPDKSQQEVDEEQEQQFADSQSSAETAALRELGCPVEVHVKDLPGDSPSAGKLQVGDVIISVDGEQVTSGANLVELAQAKPAGTTRTIGFRRDGRIGSTDVTTGKNDAGDAIIGVGIEQKQPCRYEVKIDLDKIGGPSAGLMFALGIIDKLSADDLTGGLTIAGTGEITDDGEVGPIGGIPEKLIAAKRDGASVFLTPADNCAEALHSGPPKGLRLVKVSTLDNALDALRDLRDHRTPPLCTG